MRTNARNTGEQALATSGRREWTDFFDVQTAGAGSREVEGADWGVGVPEYLDPFIGAASSSQRPELLCLAFPRAARSFGTWMGERQRMLPKASHRNGRGINLGHVSYNKPTRGSNQNGIATRWPLVVTVAVVRLWLRHFDIVYTGLKLPVIDCNLGESVGLRVVTAFDCNCITAVNAVNIAPRLLNPALSRSV